LSVVFDLIFASHWQPACARRRGTVWRCPAASCQSVFHALDENGDRLLVSCCSF